MLSKDFYFLKYIYHNSLKFGMAEVQDAPHYIAKDYNPLNLSGLTQ